jgi:integrase/recombinase XerC
MSEPNTLPLNLPLALPARGTGKETRPEAQSPAASLVSSLAQAAQALAQIASALARPEGIPPASVLAMPGAPAGPAGVSVVETCNDLLVTKAKAGRTDKHLANLRRSMSWFCAGRAYQSLSAVTPADVEAWLDALPYAPKTRKNALNDVRSLFNFALRRGMIGFNPAAGVEAPRLTNAPPEVHTPEQTALVLETARRMDIDLCRCLAIRYFAGLRTSEAAALEEKEILLEQGLIEVSAAKAKTRRRRLVTIEPNLRAWLALGGRLPLRDKNTRFWRLVKAAGVPWPHNAPRHSFCSYHLALYENAARTALQAGHSEEMLFRNYRALVTQEAARRFFALRPA